MHFLSEGFTFMCLVFVFLFVQRWLSIINITLRKNFIVGQDEKLKQEGLNIFVCPLMSFSQLHPSS
jgi:hypothetical protein